MFKIQNIMLYGGWNGRKGEITSVMRLCLNINNKNQTILG